MTPVNKETAWRIVSWFVICFQLLTASGPWIVLAIGTAVLLVKIEVTGWRSDQATIAHQRDLIERKSARIDEYQAMVDRYQAGRRA